MTSTGAVTRVAKTAGLIWWCMSVATHAQGAPDPTLSTEALSALLGIADRPIARKSSCFGHYGQQGRPKVKDLLASRLAYLHRGDNVVNGICTATKCEVEITHAAAEDVASIKIEFARRRGVVDVGSLHCLMTP